MALNRNHSKEGGVVVPGGERCGAGGTGGTGGRSRGAGGTAGRGPATLRRGRAPGERPSGRPSSGPVCPRWSRARCRAPPRVPPCCRGPSALMAAPRGTAALLGVAPCPGPANCSFLRCSDAWGRPIRACHNNWIQPLLACVESRFVFFFFSLPNQKILPIFLLSNTLQACHTQGCSIYSGTFLSRWQVAGPCLNFKPMVSGSSPLSVP